MTTKLIIFGAAGRMGDRLLTLGNADSECKIVAAIESAQHPKIGENSCVAGVKFSSTFDGEADCIIDFSSPAATDALFDFCAAKKLPLVLATTGLSFAHEEKLKNLAAEVAVLRSPSMSQAVILTMQLAEMAAKSLAPQQPDVEIIERHHRYKEDAPSGTALKFGEIVASALGTIPKTVENSSLGNPAAQRGGGMVEGEASYPTRFGYESRHGRVGKVGARSRNEIGYHAVRAGDNPGEHQIIFGMLGETIELTVKATNRDCYALGALAAAKFLCHQKAGIYSMRDMLFR